MEAWQLERMLEQGRVATPILQRAAINLFVASTVKTMIEGDASPLQARRLLDQAVSQSKSVTAQDRQAMIHALHAQFGMEALVRQLTYLGQRVQGVEAPEAVAALGDWPSIRLDGTQVFAGRAALVSDVFDTLSGRKKVSAHTHHQVAEWCGIGGIEGSAGAVLTLHRKDGEQVDEAEFAAVPTVPGTIAYRAGV